MISWTCPQSRRNRERDRQNRIRLGSTKGTIRTKGEARARTAAPRKVQGKVAADHISDDKYQNREKPDSTKKKTTQNMGKGLRIDTSAEKNIAL